MTDASSNIISSGSLGALSFNLNQSLGWVFGDATEDQVRTYSDLVWDSSVSKHRDIVGNPAEGFANFAKSTTDQKYITTASSALSGPNGRHDNSYAPADYAELFGKEDYLLGMSFFPWSPVGLLGADQRYHAPWPRWRPLPQGQPHA